MENCQGCGEERKLNEDGLCRTCNKLKKEGAFDMPPLKTIVKDKD